MKDAKSLQPARTASFSRTARSDGATGMRSRLISTSFSGWSVPQEMSSYDSFKTLAIAF
jgi:hypothetical protein